jgi:hypothetical protein
VLSLTLRFHFSGWRLGLTWSYATEISVPSFSTVIRINISTGILKKWGYSSPSSWWYSWGWRAKMAMKKKVTSCRVHAILWGRGGRQVEGDGDRRQESKAEGESVSVSVEGVGCGLTEKKQKRGARNTAAVPKGAHYLDPWEEELLLLLLLLTGS